MDGEPGQSRHRLETELPRPLRPLVPFLRGFAVLVASADEMRLGGVFRVVGFLLVALAAANGVLMIVYASLGLDWVGRLESTLVTLSCGMFGVGFARLVSLRRRLRAEAAQ